MPPRHLESQTVFDGRRIALAAAGIRPVIGATRKSQTFGARCRFTVEIQVSHSGLLHCLGEAGLERCKLPGSCVGKQLADEFYLPSNAWLLVMDVAAFDSSDRLNPAQGRFG